MKLHRIGLALLIVGCMGVIVSYLDPRADILAPVIIAAIGCALYINF